MQGTTGAGTQGTTGTQGVQGIQGTNTTTTTINAQSTNYTFALADQDKLVAFSNTGIQYISVPTNASVAFPIGAVVHVTGWNTGTYTIQAVTPGTTSIQSTGATVAVPKLRAQYSGADVVKIATDTWQVFGDVS